MSSPLAIPDAVAAAPPGAVAAGSTAPFRVGVATILVAFEYRLPQREEVDIWHNPPLFFAVAGGAERVAKRFFGIDGSYRGAQLVSLVGHPRVYGMVAR